MVVTGQAGGTTLQGVLAASSVVGIARIINKMCNICGDKTCLVLLLFIIHSLTPPPQSSTLSSTWAPTQLFGFSSLSSHLSSRVAARHNEVHSSRAKFIVTSSNCRDCQEHHRYRHQHRRKETLPRAAWPPRAVALCCCWSQLQL